MKNKFHIPYYFKLVLFGTSFGKIKIKLKQSKKLVNFKVNKKYQDFLNNCRPEFILFLNFYPKSWLAPRQTVVSGKPMAVSQAELAMAVININLTTSICSPHKFWTNANLQNVFRYNCHESTIKLSTINNKSIFSRILKQNKI